MPGAKGRSGGVRENAGRKSWARRLADRGEISEDLVGDGETAMLTVRVPGPMYEYCKKQGDISSYMRNLIMADMVAKGELKQRTIIIDAYVYASIPGHRLRYAMEAGTLKRVVDDAAVKLGSVSWDYVPSRISVLSSNGKSAPESNK